MSYTVFIPTAGTGSRLENLTSHLNKSLVSVANKTLLSHIIERFSPDNRFVIALGYQGHLVRSFLEIAYSHLNIQYVDINPYAGTGSGLGHTLRSSKEYLQCPFVFAACDSLVKNSSIKSPAENWLGYTTRALDNSSQYRTIRVKDSRVHALLEKNSTYEGTSLPYIGIAGINNYKEFWLGMNLAEESDSGEALGLNYLLGQGLTVKAEELEWFDAGNRDSLLLAQQEFSQDDTPNILYKDHEAIWFTEDLVVKYSRDSDFIANRVLRSQYLSGYVPPVHASGPNMYAYKMVQGNPLSEVLTEPLFFSLLNYSKDFWKTTLLSSDEYISFKRSCQDFYQGKTVSRVAQFHDKYSTSDTEQIINGKSCPPTHYLLGKLDWDRLSSGLPGRFHGDFHTENIIYNDDTGTFTFIDWRQDFAGKLDIGDIYYDLAKLLHGLIINHGIIHKNLFSVNYSESRVTYDFHRLESLVKCQSLFDAWLISHKYDIGKVYCLTALIYLNIAALHHHPYDQLLYSLGKLMLTERTL